MTMRTMPGDEPERLLDPIDRISEILFGLIMAVTIVGGLSIASAGQAEMRTVTQAALGCNIAWGLVDAVMYLVRTWVERTRNKALAKRIVGADAATARRLIEKTLPEHVAALAGPEGIEGMRLRLLKLPIGRLAKLRPRDYLEAFGIFLMVVIATFPVVAPFLLMADATSAMTLSRLITIGMLFLAGYALGRYAGHGRPHWIGVIAALFGAVLIMTVKALGG
jgi:VIT1/CCC1 family predicted Fe2+/Mn2+ transporter